MLAISRFVFFLTCPENRLQYFWQNFFDVRHKIFAGLKLIQCWKKSFWNSILCKPRNYAMFFQGAPDFHTDPYLFVIHGTCDEAAYVKGASVTRSMVICVNFKSMVVHLWTYNLLKVPLIKPPTILPAEQLPVVHINILCCCLFFEFLYYLVLYRTSSALAFLSLVAIG